MKFILGSAGSGKSCFCIEEIAQRLQNDGKNIYLVVPDQASFINEKQLAEKCGGFFDAQVTGFGRLSYAAAEFLQQPRLPLLNETGRVMLTAKLLAEHKNELKSFAGSADKLGFAQGLQAIFEEFRTFNTDVAGLHNAAESVHSNFSEKLQDIVLLYECYLAETEGRFADANDNLAQLAEAVDNGFMQGAAVYFDGFASLDPVQFDIIAAMLRQGIEVNFTLPLSVQDIRDDISDEHYLFRIKELYLKLCELCEKETGKQPVIINMNGANGRFAANSELQWLSQKMFPLSINEKWQEVPQNIHIDAAANQRQEIMGVGRRILQLVRDKGYRFSEISICARNIADYQDEIEQVFIDMGIPYFIDGKKEMLNHPVIELLRTALEVAIEKPNYKQIFSYLKNTFSPLSWKEVSVLENYCLAQGIKFYHWRMEKAWTYYAHSLGEKGDPEREAKELEYINAARFKGTAELWRFCDALHGRHCVSEQIAALRELMKQLQIEEKTEALYKNAIKEGRAEDAEIHRQALQGVYELFEQAENLLGDAVLSVDIFAQILDSGFAALRTAMIPPSVDRVFVASIERSRTPAVKATFVLGLNEGIFPAKISSAGILNGRDRDILAQQGIELAPSAVARQLAEYYYIYVAYTRPSEHLFLSYTLSNADEQALLPSIAVRRIKHLFPQLQEGNYNELPLEMEVGGNDTLAHLAVELRRRDSGEEIEPYWEELKTQYEILPEYADNLHRVMSGLYFKAGPKPLSKESIASLFKQNLYSSVSRLEAFNSCPLAYFAGYSLKLRKRAEYKLTPPDLGQLFHAVMENVCREITEQNILWQDITEEKAAEIVSRHTEALMPDFLGNILNSGARFAYLQERFILTLTNALMIMARQMAKGEFRQLGWEITFGVDKVLPTFDIALPNGCVLKLSGCIDRLDAAVKNDKVWLRVIDYKSGNKDLKIQDVYNGLSLQLLVYLQVAMLHSKKLGLQEEPHAAGGFYFTFKDNFEKIAYNDDLHDPFEVKMKGLAVEDMEAIKLADRNISGKSTVIPVTIKKDGSFGANTSAVTEEELQLLQKHLINMLIKSAEELYQGVVTAVPDKNGACSYCDFKSFCGFDYDFAPGKEAAESLKKADILKKIREEIANNDD